MIFRENGFIKNIFLGCDFIDRYVVFFNEEDQIAALKEIYPNFEPDLNFEEKEYFKYDPATRTITYYDNLKDALSEARNHLKEIANFVIKFNNINPFSVIAEIEFQELDI